MTEIVDRYKRPGYLVNTYWLEKNLDTVGLLVFDCTVDVMPNPDPVQKNKFPFIYESGRNNYEQAHIPHAGFIDILNDLSDLSSDIPLMHPQKKEFVEAMNRYGISNDSHVVLYSSTESNWAARVWWMMRAFGFHNVAILDGGWKKWSAEGRPQSNKPCSYEMGRFTARVIPDAFVNKGEVLGVIGGDEVRIISALPSSIHKGESDIAFGRKGRISGSVNVPFTDLHDPVTGCYLPVSQLQKMFGDIGVDNAERIITYCGGGIAASNNAFVLALLGYDNISVYDGSMLEWGNDVSLPMEAG